VHCQGTSGDLTLLLQRHFSPPLQFKRADAAAVLAVATALATNPAPYAAAALASAPPPAPGSDPLQAQHALLLGVVMAGYQLLSDLVRPEGGNDACSALPSMLLSRPQVLPLSHPPTCTPGQVEVG
jgi:hypothetical protein